MACGRSNSRPAPVKRTFWAVRLNSGIMNRSVEPLSLQKTGRVTVTKPPAVPCPLMVTEWASSVIFAPSWAAAPSVARMSLLYSIFVIWLGRTAPHGALRFYWGAPWPFRLSG